MYSTFLAFTLHGEKNSETSGTRLDANREIVIAKFDR